MPPIKRGPPAALFIDSTQHRPHIALENSASTLDSSTSEADYPPFNRPSKPRSLQNMKKLSLNLPSAQSSTTSLASSIQPDPPALERPRRPSVISLPPTTGNPMATTRKVEDGSPTVPYLDGPIQVIPGVWLGSEENAKDWARLRERGIKSILNVAKEVVSPFDNAPANALRGFASTPNLNTTMDDSDSTYYPANIATGRPSMHYLKLQWSHGQQNLVEHGFPEAMAFTDAALERGDGVLIHCQLGISRSATFMIALIMRAAAERSPSVPSEIWALKGMQGAYTFLKEKSKWVGPNMSLIYQLLDYEKKLRGDGGDMSGTESGAEDEEWGRRRQMLDDATDDDEDEQRQSSLIMREAQYLDKAMEARILARKSSTSSVASSSSGGVGMGAAWRNRYASRKRTGSIASNMTNGSSIISEDLVEEDEEQELLGIGGGFNDDDRGSSAEPDSQSSPEDDVHSAVTPRRPGGLPPSAPVWKTSFNLPPPASAFRPTFNLPPTTKGKRRPTPLVTLPAVPPSPIKIVVDDDHETPIKPRPLLQPLPPIRTRTESKKPAPPPLHLRTSLKTKTPNPPSALATPSQTLFLFPPSPTTLTSRTPSAMTLSNMNGPLPFPSLTTPRVSTFRSEGRTRSFIGVGAPPTPTTAFSKVDARGYFGGLPE
ncbi:Dual specificity catalytic domain-containing protein [Mycena indigotica]|uniref:protein-tyrosine-phosphatase n=1 Tax=Mycena indigotica TaxID=2126181 RepID=A0A8H6SYI2_9AGAR|nr:Dual specificity catalytic domain-containing protein [Mycena indigotica]KAF7306657.1 Dual specificity catalytic domain-containing protein [Mycena indigotica]